MAEAAEQQPGVTEHLQKEFDALKLAMETKYRPDIERQQAVVDLLIKQVSQQQADIKELKEQNAGLKEHMNHLLIPGTNSDITQGKANTIPIHYCQHISHNTYNYLYRY